MKPVLPEKLHMMKIALTLFLPLLFAATLFADSPLTSTDIAGYYIGDYAVVSNAKNAGTLTDSLAMYLDDKSALIDVKAAVINAIGWNYDGTSNAETFRTFLAKKYNTTPGNLDLRTLRADELFCLGYLRAMDDYFNVDSAIQILSLAKTKAPKSFTVNIILAVVKGQQAMDFDFCKVWQVTSEVLQDNSLQRDMKTDAIQDIVNYMILYKSDCNG